MTSDCDDDSRALNLKAGAQHYRAYIGNPAYFDIMAVQQFRVLTDEGLREHHHVLDVGCGSLRLGRLLLPYLLPDRYVGVEPEEWLVHEGIRRELGESIREVKRPLFCFDPECDLAHFGRTFDYVMAQSVITHSPFDWAVRFASRVACVLAKPGGTLLGTYRPGEKDYEGGDWVYPGVVTFRTSTLRTIFSEFGLTFENLDEYRHPSAVTWFRSRWVG